MVMAERYGIPSTKIISLMSAWKVPFRNVQTGDRLLVMTDDSMDPMVWQSAMAALQERGVLASGFGSSIRLLRFPGFIHFTEAAFQQSIVKLFKDVTSLQPVEAYRYKINIVRHDLRQLVGIVLRERS